MPESSCRAWLLNALLVAVSSIVGLGLLEVGLRLTSPFELRLSGHEINLPVGKRYLIDNPDIPGLDPLIVHSKNKLGFRGPDWPDDAASRTKWIFVGGSTTEGFYISDGRTWPEQVAALLGRSDLWVNNAGLDGHTTFGHLILLRQFVASLKPQAVFFLAGINDVGYQAPKPYDERLTARLDFGRWLSTRTEIGRLVSSALAVGKARRMNIDHAPVQFSRLAERPAVEPQFEQELERHKRDFIPAFGRRVAELADFCRQMGAVPVFLTQPALYGPVKDLASGKNLGLVEAEGQSGALRWAVLELYNAETRRVAAAEGAVLIDLAGLLPKDSRLFYDFIHFNDAGNRTVAELVAQEIRVLGVGGKR